MAASGGKNETSASEEQNTEFQQQVEAYIAWVNSQLKKQPGIKPVKDLNTDFADGVVLIRLVEIISGEKLKGIISPANSLEEKQHNVKIVLQYLTSQNIRVHHIAESDIVKGNVKSLMRLILTLAAHFKPSSVGVKKSVSAAAANATAALGDMQKHFSAAGGLRPRWKSGSPMTTERRFHRESPYASPMSSRTISLQSNSPDQHHLSFETDDRHAPVLSEANVFASPEHRHMKTQMSSTTPNKTLSSVNNEVILSSGGNLSKMGDFLAKYHEELQEDLASTRDLVSVLQNILLNGEVLTKNDADHDDVCEALEPSTLDEELLILRSKLDLSLHENARLKTELTHLRQENRSTSASKAALRSRAQQQDNDMLALKQQILKLNLANDKLTKEKSMINSQLEEQRKEKQTLTLDLAEKNKSVEQLTNELGRMSTQLKKLGNDSKTKLMSAQKLEVQVQELSNQLRILQRYNNSSRTNGNEKAVITESLNSLRSNLPPHDSRQHIIDTLEQAVLSISDQPKLPWRSEASTYHNNGSSRPSTSYSPRNRKKDFPQNSSSTTVIYFTERNMTPVRATIYKKIGDITLRDFKGILHHTDRYKYNFKALDPEFGTVKKEIFSDEDIVPGWEGKIVAWLERENGNS